MSTATTAPAITCPAWCTVDPAEHVADLPNWEGRVIHHSADVEVSGSILRTMSTTLPSGTIDPTDPPRVHLISTADELTEAEAHELGMALVRAGDRLRRDGQRGGR